MNNKRKYYIVIFLVLLILQCDTSFSYQYTDDFDDILLRAYQNPDLLKNKAKLILYLKAIKMLKKEDKDTYIEDTKTQAFLEAAYRIKSYDMLKEFFDAWAFESVPFDSIEYRSKPQFEKEAYNIFYKVFKPLNMQEVIPGLYGNDSINSEDNIYLNKKYLFIQERMPIELFQEEKYEGPYCNRIYYNKNDTIYYNVKSKYHIVDFRPKILLNGYKIIYCTEELLSIIKNFLGNMIFDNNSREFKLSKASKERLDFLNHFTSIFTSDYSDFYIIETLPIIGNISINFNTTESVVDIRIGDRIIKLSMSKIDGIWEIVYKSEIVY